jgi:hypothetical protein
VFYEKWGRKQRVIPERNHDIEALVNVLQWIQKI